MAVFKGAAIFFMGYLYNGRFKTCTVGWSLLVI